MPAPRTPPLETPPPALHASEEDAKHPSEDEGDTMSIEGSVPPLEPATNSEEKGDAIVSC